MIRATYEDWTSYWFSPRPFHVVVPVRIAVCTVAATWFLSFWSSLAIWFGDQGILSTELSSKLIAYEGLASWQMWSPLWWSDGTLLYYAWLASGVLLSILAGLGIGGRPVMSLLLIWTIAWTHRIVWLIGPVEPALIAFVAYLIFEPGPSILRRAVPAKCNWSATTAVRLLQTHWWILIAVGLASQAASLIWWRGEGVWWLAAAERSTVLSVATLTDRAYLVNAITHGFILLQVLTLWLILLRNARWIGIVLGIAVCLSIGLIADQLLYSALLAAALVSFVEFPSPTTSAGDEAMKSRP